MNRAQRMIQTVTLPVPTGVVAVAFASIVVLGMFLFAATAHSQQVKALAFGAVVQGTVVDFKGETWTFYGCRGDVITATMQSAVLSPYLELDANPGPQSLVEQPASGNRALIGGFALPADGVYNIIAGPERRTEHGPYTLTLTLSDTAPAAVDGAITAGETITGEIRNHFGNALSFHGCQGQVINIAMSSPGFAPNLALLNKTGDQVLAEGKALPGTTDSWIEHFTITNTAYYLIMASGSKASDRGVYSLTLTLANTTTQRTGLTDTVIAANPAVPTSTPTPPPAQMGCTVKTSLNLRSGPGTVYPPVSGLAANAKLHPLARTTANDWLQVQVLPAGLTGWVAASYVTCNSDSSTLPVGVIPAPPTLAPPTATPTPTQIAQIPSPTPPAFLALQGGQPGGDFKGRMVTEQGMAVDQGDNTYLFRNRMYFRLEVSRTSKNRPIDHVDFTITRTDNNSDDTPVHTQKEGSAAYCSFGGGEPNCTVLMLKPGARWPSTNLPIENGEYRIDADLFLKGQGNSVNWSVNFVINMPGQGGGNNAGNSDQQNGGQSGANLVANIVQTGPGNNNGALSDALVFQVEAYNPAVGNQDGDGIANVDMEIFGPNGQRIYHRTEGTAHYCAFQGGEPDCNVWRFAEHDFHWPNNGPRLQPGKIYTLRAVVHAKNGQNKEVKKQIRFQS